MRKSTVLLLVVALASAGVAAGFWMELRAERALNAELIGRLHAAAAAPIVAPAPVAAPASVANPPAPSPTIVAVPTPTELAFPKSAPIAQGSWQERQRQLMSDLKYRENWREQQRLRLATRRDNLIRLLGITPEQSDAVIDLSIDREMRMQMQEGVSADGEQEHQVKLRELLGEDKVAQLQVYMESRQSRMQVDRFRIQLTGGDVLRDDQVEPLIAALHAEQSQMQQELAEYRDTLGSEDYAERQMALMKAAHKRMHSAASGILTNSQIDRLDAMLKREIERQEAQQRMARIQSKMER